MATKVSDKSNELSLILESHFGGKMNRARIKFMALMIMALCKVQTVNFERLAQGFESSADTASSLRRIQRFMAAYVLNMDIIARLIFSLLPHKPPYRLLIDRTNWQYGSSKINILVLAIAYKGLSFPVIYQVMPTRGASHSDQRIAIIERYIRLFSKESIKDLLADREFIGDKWLNYLMDRQIKYHIRVLAHHGVMRHANDWKRKARCIFASLRINQFKALNKMYYINNSPCYLSAYRFINDKGKIDLLIIASLQKHNKALAIYKQRWQIETMFRALKTSGFNIENTHLTDINRLEKLLAIIFMAFIWAYLTGLYIHKKIKKIRVLKHGRKAKSFFKYGLDYICEWLLNTHRQQYRNPIDFLSCT